MRGVVCLLVAFLLCLPSAGAWGGESEVLVSGKGFKITKRDFDLLLKTMPEEARKKLLNDRFSMYKYLTYLAELEVFSRIAKEQGLDRDPVIQKLVDLSVKQVLAKAYLNREIERRLKNLRLSDGDLKSYYEANKEEFKTANGTYMPFDAVKELIKKKLIEQYRSSQFRVLEEEAFHKFGVRIASGLGRVNDKKE